MREFFYVFQNHEYNTFSSHPNPRNHRYKTFSKSDGPKVSYTQDFENIKTSLTAKFLSLWLREIWWLEKCFIITILKNVKISLTTKVSYFMDPWVSGPDCKLLRVNSFFQKSRKFDKVLNHHKYLSKHLNVTLTLNVISFSVKQIIKLKNY